MLIIYVGRYCSSYLYCSNNSSFITIPAYGYTSSMLQTSWSYCISKVLLEWVKDITGLLHTSDTEEEQKILAARILDLALSCYATFDIDECHLTSIFSSLKNVSIAIECAVTVYDRCPAANEGRDASIDARMAQFVRCSRSIELTSREHILTGASGIDITIDRLWSGYEPSGKWTVMWD